MKTDTMTNHELAESYVAAYIANLPHDEEAGEIERRGVTYDAMRDALGVFAYQGLTANMNYEEIDKEHTDATNRLAALMSPTRTVTRKICDLCTDRNDNDEITVEVDGDADAIDVVLAFDKALHTAKCSSCGAPIPAPQCLCEPCLDALLRKIAVEMTDANKRNEIITRLHDGGSNVRK